MQASGHSPGCKRPPRLDAAAAAVSDAGGKGGGGMARIDLNSDLGEGFGPWAMGDDDAMLSLVTSANVAAGGHASDPDTMFATLSLAAARGVVVGMLGCFLLGLVWIVTFYFVGQDGAIPVMKDLDQYNLLVGIGFMAVGFTFATKWE